MTTESQPHWTYPLLTVAQNKERRRTGTPLGTAYDLIGVDGSVDGGIRPFPGFNLVTELEYGFDSDIYSGGSLKDAFPLLFRIDDQTFAWGFLYRVAAPGATPTECVYRLKLRIGNDTPWFYERDWHAVNFARGLLGVQPFANEQMDVVVDGRFVYVYRTGLAPFMFYLATGGSGPGSTTLIVTTDIGPGPQPELLIPANNSACAREKESSPGVPHPDLAQSLVDLTASIPTGGVDASARILLFGFSKHEKVSQNNITFSTSPFVETRDTDGVALALRGPSDLRLPDNSLLWTTPPFPDPSFSNAILYANGQIVPPGWSFPTPRGEYNGHRYDLDKRNVPDEEPIGVSVDATFVWAYQLVDSRTGRRSAISKRLSTVVPRFAHGGAYYTTQYIQSNGLLSSFIDYRRVTFPMLYIIYNSAKYDRLLLYRGQKVAGLKDDQVPLSLESVVKLADYHTTKQPVSPDTDWKVAAYFVQLSDEELVQQSPLFQQDDYLEDVPTAGSALLFEGITFLGRFGKQDSVDGDGVQEDKSGLGLARWSSPLEQSSEMYAVGDRYLLAVPAEEVERWLPAGPNIFALTRLGIYLFRKETLRVKAFPSHGTFGIVNARAACRVGSTVYFLTTDGLKAISSNGELSDIVVLNGLVQGAWRNSLGGIEMSTDEEAKLIVMHNPSLEHAALLWFTTSKVTEVVDCTFKHVRDGWCPPTPSAALSASNQLQRRSLFFQEYAWNAVLRWRVMAIDIGRSKSQRTLMPFNGVTRYSLTLGHAGGTTTLPVEGNALGEGSEIEGCYIYALDGSHAGEKWKVVKILNSTSVQVATTLPELAAGTRMGISPVYMRWTGHQLGLNAEEAQGGFQFGDSHDQFRMRQADMVGCAFVDVTGDAATDTVNNDARYRGGVYKGNAASPAASAFPVRPQGTGTKYKSVVDGAPVVWANFFEAGGVIGPAIFPFVEVFCPSLDYTLLEVRVAGSLESGLRESILT